ncbi:MAG: nitronate monooxygenase [Alphaproteobacteria bacterium]|jgi:enoyl-[acyl-carrier protein] reductase II|nr:nitronate monooxygenase [Alphaproteobacteria bacterium]MDP6565789.1 nitronate monooxygenase [Alphaproteobacteria bacterium]MDP6816233.1 nitronate monooxygenase [Alphaproteobacteria bacterium]
MTPEQMFTDNPLCRMLGIRYPICQAGMYQVAYGPLAAAVSNAGGLGVIGAAYMAPERLREEIRIARNETDQPFGVDILFAKVEGGGATVEDYQAEVRGHLEVTFEEGVSVLVAGLGDPGPVVAQAHADGMKVMALVGTARQAAKVEASGVDVVIASGHEGGGHVGRIGTMALIPRVVDRVAVPVLAAGGLADGRGLAASLALGAVGVWMGTRFIATVEARGHDNYKNRIAEIDEDGTIVSRAHSGKPNRMIRNQFTRSWEGREAEIQPYPHQLKAVGEPASIRGRIEGDVENGVLACGQSAGLIDGVETAGEVVRAIAEGAARTLRGLPAAGE